jgi:prepilin peptidase CpaA
LGLAALLPLYLLRTMGAGDVKLMAMVGAFLGSAQILGAVLGTFLAGFFLALVFAFKAQAIKRLLHNLRIIFIGSYIQFASNKLPLADETYVSVGKMPYALAIALGTFGYLSLPLANQLLR